MSDPSIKLARHYQDALIHILDPARYMDCCGCCNDCGTDLNYSTDAEHHRADCPVYIANEAIYTASDKVR